METPLLAALSLYLSTSKSLEDISKDTGDDIVELKRVAKRDKWSDLRKAANQRARQMVAKDVIGDKIAAIRALQAAERRTLTKRLKTLESALDALDPLAEKEIDRLTVSKLKTYAETLAIIQRMLYRSYGIDDRQGQDSGDGIFSAVRPGSVVTRYRIDKVVVEGIKDPFRQGNDTPPPDPHLTHTDVTNIEKAEPYSAHESIAEVVEAVPERRRRGKLSGYELTDVFDNITKEARDEEGREECSEGPEGTGGEADERAEGDVEAAQSGVVDEGLDVVVGEEAGLDDEAGEAEGVGPCAGDSGRGAEEDDEACEEGAADSGVPGLAGGCGHTGDVEEGPGTSGGHTGDSFESIFGNVR